MQKQYRGQCRNCYRLPDRVSDQTAEWCDSPRCQKIKGDLEQGRIYDTGKRGPHNATGDLEFTCIVIGRPDLSYDNTVWAFATPTGGGKYLPVTACNDELKMAA
jgi:hypothetical protein